MKMHDSAEDPIADPRYTASHLGLPHSLSKKAPVSSWTATLPARWTSPACRKMGVRSLHDSPSSMMRTAFLAPQYWGLGGERE
jgi:hypothetical protein